MFMRLTTAVWLLIVTIAEGKMMGTRSSRSGGMSMGMGMGSGKGMMGGSKYWSYTPHKYSPPDGPKGVELPETPDWVLYGQLTPIFGTANAQQPPDDLTGGVSYGTFEGNPLYLDEGETQLAAYFGYDGRFVGSTTLPAIVNGAISILDGTEEAGKLFFTGVQSEDFSSSFAIVGGSGRYMGITGQITVPPIVAGVTTPVNVYFF